MAAFDFDGTLVAGDSLTPFLTRVRGRRTTGLILAASGPAMVTAYRSAGRDGAKAVLLRRAMAGLVASGVAAKGEIYGRYLAGRVRPTMAARMAWHRSEGHRLVLVSASLSAYLEPFGRAVGIDEVIATRLEEGPDGRLTGRIYGANVRGPTKAARLTEAFGGQSVELWAYGDSAGDREMLAMADHPVLVGVRRQVTPPSPSRLMAASDAVPRAVRDTKGPWPPHR